MQSYIISRTDFNWTMNTYCTCCFYWVQNKLDHLCIVYQWSLFKDVYLREGKPQKNPFFLKAMPLKRGGVKALMARPLQKYFFCGIPKEDPGPLRWGFMGSSRYVPLRGSHFWQNAWVVGNRATKKHLKKKKQDRSVYFFKEPDLLFLNISSFECIFYNKYRHSEKVETPLTTGHLQSNEVEFFLQRNLYYKRFSDVILRNICRRVKSNAMKTAFDRDSLTFDSLVF